MSGRRGSSKSIRFWQQEALNWKHGFYRRGKCGELKPQEENASQARRKTLDWMDFHTTGMDELDQMLHKLWSRTKRQNMVCCETL